MKNTPKIFHKNYFFLIIPLLFLFDLAFLNIFHKQLLECLLCFYVLALYKTHYSTPFLYLLFFLTLEQQIFFDSFFMPALFFGIVTLLFKTIASYIHPSVTFHCYGTLVLLIMTKNLLLLRSGGVFNGLNLYTLQEIFANLILLFVVLKYMARGKLDNRL